MRAIFIIIVIAIIAGVGWYYWDGQKPKSEGTWVCKNYEWVPEGNPLPGTKPNPPCGTDLIKKAEHMSKETCEAEGGKWNPVDPDKGCILQALDGGKICSGPEDCESKICIAALAEDEVKKVKNKETIERTGICSDWGWVGGCYYPVKDGKVSQIQCIGIS